MFNICLKFIENRRKCIESPATAGRLLHSADGCSNTTKWPSCCFIFLPN